MRRSFPSWPAGFCLDVMAYLFNSCAYFLPECLQFHDWTTAVATIDCTSDPHKGMPSIDVCNYSNTVYRLPKSNIKQLNNTNKGSFFLRLFRTTINLVPMIVYKWKRMKIELINGALPGLSIRVKTKAGCSMRGLLLG